MSEDAQPKPAKDEPKKEAKPEEKASVKTEAKTEAKSEKPKMKCLHCQRSERALRKVTTRSSSNLDLFLVLGKFIPNQLYYTTFIGKIYT